MELLKKSDYPLAAEMAKQVAVDTVYPLSIAEGFQSGEIFADSAEHPHTLLYWHTCGFGFTAGELHEDFVREIVGFMRNPRPNHSGRLALEAGTDEHLEQLLLADGHIRKQEQHMFSFAGKKQAEILADTEIEPITAENYDQLAGRITPRFSWDSTAQFLQNGFGFCVFCEGKFAACAFSAGISRAYVDIGVETAEAFRGMGYGRRVVSRMIAEILRRGQIPVWQCHVSNEASKRLAVSQGFALRGTHPLYVYENP